MLSLESMKTRATALDLTKKVQQQHFAQWMLLIIYQNNEHDGWQEDLQDCKEPCPPLEELGIGEFFIKKRRVYNFGNVAKIFLNTMFFHRTISSFRPSLILKPVVEWYTRFFNIKKYYSPSAKWPCWRCEISSAHLSNWITLAAAVARNYFMLAATDCFTDSFFSLRRAPDKRTAWKKV